MPNPVLLQNPVRPTWKWDFTTGKAPSGATYTGSGGTYFNSSGVLTAATTNVPRFDYDPATLSPLGYLAEMASTNGLLRSNTFDNAVWTKQRCSVASGAATGPDGTSSMYSLTEDGTSGGHEVYQSLTLATDTYVGVSCFFRAGTRSKVWINLQGTSANHYASAVFDLSTGAMTQSSTGATSGTLASTSIRAVGNSIYRCSIVAKVSTTNPLVVLGLTTAATGNTFNTFGEINYAGDGASLVYIYGAQVDSAGVGVTSYIPTAGATASRTQDVLSMPLTSLPGWSASQGGVLVAAYRLHTLMPSTPGNQANFLYLRGSDFNNSVILCANNGGGGTRRSFVFSGGATQIDVGAGVSSPTVFTRTRQALGWGTSRGVMAHDGTLDDGDSGTLALPVSPSTLEMGSYNSNSFNGTLESIAYYRGARSDAFVQAVSR